MAPLPAKELLAQLEALAANPTELEADAALRSQLCFAARKASVAVEKPEDTVARVLLTQPVEATATRIAWDLKLFTALDEGGSPKTLAQLAETTKAHPALLSRVLRALATFGAVVEVDTDKYAIAPSHKLFANAQFAEGLAACQDFLNASYQALPAWLAEKEYTAPSDPTDTGVQKAFDAKGKDLINILMSKPTSARGFGTLMSTWGEGNSLIQDLLPVEEHLGKNFDESGDKVMWVDVGGGYGQKTIALKQACPKIPGRFIVQDLPGTVENAPKVDGIEMMGHDFFTEQPVKGARAYYIRQCLHNWPSDKCATILKQIRGAMKPGYSTLFVHELIVRERDASNWTVTQDFNMMTLCATMERTVQDWTKLLEETGFKVVGVHNPKDGVSEGIIEAEAA